MPGHANSINLLNAFGRGEWLMGFVYWGGVVGDDVKEILIGRLGAAAASLFKVPILGATGAKSVQAAESSTSTVASPTKSESLLEKARLYLADRRFATTADSELVEPRDHRGVLYPIISPNEHIGFFLDFKW